MAINPVVDIANYSEDIPDYYSVKRIFELQNYKNSKFFTYSIGEDGSSNIPAEPNSYYFWSCGLVMGATSGTSPFPFISNSAWGTLGSSGISNSPCGFMNPATGTIMPKLLIPTVDLVDNGIAIGSDAGIYGEHRGAFNWTVTAIDGADTSLDDPTTLGYLNSNATEGAKYISSIYKNDNVQNSSIKLHCAINPERSAMIGSYSETPEKIIGNGACLLMLNVEPHDKGAVKTGLTAGTDKWSIAIEFPNGEIKLNLDSTGSLLVDIAGTITKAQLNQSKAKEQPPQYQKLGTKANPYCIVIYPCWNGVIVSDGVQDANDGTVKSQFCPKNKDAFALDILYSNPFDPLTDLGSPESNWGGDGSGDPSLGGDTSVGGVSPTDLNFFVDAPISGAGATNVDWDSGSGSGLDLTLHNCTAEIAYLPLFFIETLRFEEYYITSPDSADTKNWEWVYPIWTDNNGTGKMIDYEIDDSYSNPDAGDGIYRRMKYSLITQSPDFWDRYGGEVFGQYYESDENTHITIHNGDGSYPLDSFWSSPDANRGDAAPLSGWKNYIESLNVTIGLESANGSISVDKFGCAGQRATVTQNIGSLQLLAYGNYSLDFTQQWSSYGATTFDKETGTDDILFTGIGMGVGNGVSTDGASFTIPLEGRYKKIEDILLINAPYFDGYHLEDVILYLCNYGGLAFDSSIQYHGDGSLLTTPILASEEINSPAINFNAGTSVLDALNQICELTHHSFYIKRDGKLHLYQLGDNGLPRNPGFDWGGFYGSTDYTFIMGNRDETPDFEDLRNEILGLAQTKIPTSGTDIKDIPLFPLIYKLANTTNPVVPWSKMWVYPVNGAISLDVLTTIITNKAKLAQRYLLSGSISLPSGNPYIEPYDRWTIEDKTYIVESVGHNMDFNSKTWTTSVTLFGDSD